jgi:competence protein ComFB
VLNRTAPHYVVSHRGAARTEDFESQQDKADLTALAYEGIKRVSHNQRPYANHGKSEEAVPDNSPVFNIPTIMGRVFNGLNFSPVSGVSIELLQNGTIVSMKDLNWQNPFTLVPNTNGTFNFWPKPVKAEKPDLHAVFEFTLRIKSPGTPAEGAPVDFEELSHGFTVPVKSEMVSSSSFSLNRTFKLPDLYLFPPGESGQRVVTGD